MGKKCELCGHVHSGKDLAFICIGCRCQERPAPNEPGPGIVYEDDDVMVLSEDAYDGLRKK